MRERSLVTAALLVFLFGETDAQTATLNSESTAYLTVSTLRRNSEHANASSTVDSWTFAGGGFVYGHFFSRHFSTGSTFEVQFGGWPVFLATLTGNLGYSITFGESSPALFLECGYGLSFPTIIAAGLLRLDVGTMHLGGGIKLPVADDRLLRLGLYYRRFRIYGGAGSDFATFSCIGFSIGHVIAFSEPSDQR